MKKTIAALLAFIVFIGVYMFFHQPEKPTSEDTEYEHIALASVHNELEALKREGRIKSLPDKTQDDIVRSMKMDFEILRENNFYPLEMDNAITVLEYNDNELTQQTVKELYQIVDRVYDEEREYFEEHNMIRD